MRNGTGKEDMITTGPRNLMLVRFSLFTSLPVSFCRHHSLRSHHFLWSFVPYVKGSARRKETGERGEEGTDEPSEPGSDMRKEPGPCVFRLLGLVSPELCSSLNLRVSHHQTVTKGLRPPLPLSSLSLILPPHVIHLRSCREDWRKNDDRTSGMVDDGGEGE